MPTKLIVLAAGVFVGLAGYLLLQPVLERPLGASVFITQQGGTGTSSPSGILYGDGTSALKTVAIGANLTFAGGSLSATGGGGGTGTISTSTNPTIGQLAYFNSLSTIASVATGTLSTNATGLEFNNSRSLVGGAAILSLTSGYAIPLSASTTNWNTFYDTPSNRITAGTDLTWSGNTLNFDNSSGYITGVNWNQIGGTQSDINLSGFNNNSGFITGVAWGAITGTLSNQTDLNAALYNKIGTSTTLGLGQLLYATGANTASSVATTSLTASSPLSLSQPISVIGSAASALTIDTSGSWTGNAGTATALATNGSNCSAGNYPLGIDASGNVENCTVATTGTVTNIATTYPLLGGPITTTGTLSLAFGTTTSNTWAGLQTFTNASSTLFSSTYASSTLGYFGSLFLPSLGTAAGSFVAVDPNGKLIATTTPSGGGGTPGGSDTQIQYNNGGVFGGISGFTFNDGTGELSFTGTGAVSLGPTGDVSLEPGGNIALSPTGDIYVESPTYFSNGGAEYGLFDFTSIATADKTFTFPNLSGTIALTDQGQNVSFGNASTTLFSTLYASSTQYFGAGLSTCNTGNFLTWSGGLFGCAADQTGAGGGITAIGPTGQTQTGATQTLATSTDGTDFTITATGNTQTFNLPIASGTNTGKLSATDWTTFNGKESVLTFAFPLSRSANAISSLFSTTTNTGMSAGNLYIGTGGIMQTAASSSIFGFTPLNPTRQLTVAGTANQITSSAGAQDLSADRTWTLSLPNHVIFPSSFQASAGSTTNATSTNLYVSGRTQLGSGSGVLVTTSGVVSQGVDGTDFTLINANTCTNQVFSAVTAAGVFTCSSVSNAMLANSTISGISLGSNLANLTATNSTLTFSGTYNGSTARTIGLNLGNANTWTALQTFGNASTTLGSFAYASSTLWYGGGLQTCDATTGKLTWANGRFACGTDRAGEGGSGDPFAWTPNTNYGAAANSTSTPVWFTAGMQASSTSHFANASTTQLTVTGTGTSTVLLGNVLIAGDLLVEGDFDVEGALWPTVIALIAAAMAAYTITFTNKRIQPRVSSTTSAASVTPTKANYDVYVYTAQAAAFAVNNPTAEIGESFAIRILDNATPRAITWDTQYVGVEGNALPTTTTASKWIECICTKMAASTILVSYVEQD